MRKTIVAVLVSLCAAVAAGAQEMDEAALAKAAQNPVAAMISLPFQYNATFDFGPEEGILHVLNIQPVYPISAGRWNLINRTIMPMIQQPALVPGQGSEFGLSDINHTTFISPARPGKLIWGLGPVLRLPSATDERLGSEKWSGGLSAVGLTMPGNWVVGALVQNVWPFADTSARADVNEFLFQYFINYNLPNGWYLTSAPAITANWEADGDNRWTVPFGGGFGRVFRVGKRPMNAQMQVFYNAEKPEAVGDWSLRLQLQFMFPKGKK